MEYADEKRRLHESLVYNGTERGDVNYQAIPVPLDIAGKWVRNFYAPPDDVRLSETPRLLNRFCLGADPELAFFDELKRYVHAESLGMDTLAAFGCDMSGRQAELRAKPSRSALDVVASLMEALRWMAATYPVNTLKWIATSYVDYNGHKDGCGGHIHLGRKRPGIVEEIDKLDLVNAMLGAAGVFDAEGSMLRSRNTKYGERGDYRQQAHGYEYRTFPTWISDPWAAYLTLVISKLYVLHRGVIKPGPKVEQYIKNLLCFYKGLDDDALIAWKAMQVLGMPKYSNQDIKNAWGVLTVEPHINPRHCYIPSMIAPAQQTRQELFDWLTKGTSIAKRGAVPTWQPFKLPARFYKVTVQPHVFNIPDIAMGLVSKDVRVSIQASNVMTFGSNIPLPETLIRKRMSSMVHPKALQFVPNDDRSIVVGVPAGMREVRMQMQELKEVLSDSTLFPICRVEDIDTVDWSRWEKREVAKKKVLPSLGRKIATIDGQQEEGF